MNSLVTYLNNKLHRDSKHKLRSLSHKLPICNNKDRHFKKEDKNHQQVWYQMLQQLMKTRKVKFKPDKIDPKRLETSLVHYLIDIFNLWKIYLKMIVFKNSIKM